jgi:hypothetical protein
MKQTPIDEPTFLKLSNAVGEWGEANFGATTPENASDPALGFLEEVGELTHSILKKKQGIRGTAEQHDADARDALGDMGIFLLHLWYRETKLDPNIRLDYGALAPFPDLPVTVNIPRATKEALGILALSASAILLAPYRFGEAFAARWPFAYCQALNGCHRAAYLLGVDFWPQVRETWERIVSKRNWIANPDGTPEPSNPII